MNSEQNLSSPNTEMKISIIQKTLTNNQISSPNDFNTQEDGNNTTKLANNEQNQQNNEQMDQNFSKENQENPMNQTVKVNIDIGQDNEVKIDSTKEEFIKKLDYYQTPPEQQDNEVYTSENFENEQNQENSTNGQNNFDINNDTEKEDRTTQPFDGSLSQPVQKQVTIVTPKRSKSVAKTLDRQQFYALMKGTQPRSRPRTAMKTRQMSSSVPPDKVPEYADRALQGKNIHITDPLAVTDVIDELIGRRFQALDENDYMKAHKIDEAMAKVRLNYRINDRESLYNTTIQNLSQKKKMAEDDLQETKQQWKQKWKEFDQKQKEEREQQHARHIKEHEELEEFWKDPSHYYDFNKRNPVQLEHLAIERSLAMTGRFVEAEQWRKMNEKNDKIIIKENYARLQQTFDQQRQHLIELQEEDAKRLQFQQDVARKLYAEDERKEMEVKRLTVENTTRVLEEEKQFQNFCAHTYKRDPSIVIPPTCTTKGGNDLPPMPPGRIFPRGVDDKVRINSKPQTTPLPLPALKIKKYKVPRYGEKPKKKKDDD